MCFCISSWGKEKGWICTNKWTCNSNWRTIKHLWGAHQEKLRLWAAEPHTGLLSSWTALCFSSLHPWPWKCSCVLWETRRMGVAKDYVCDLILISQQEYVCVCLWVHMHQSSTNPIREMLHGNGPQRDTVMYTHVSSVFVCVEKGSETKTETVCVCVCVHVWVFWAICVHCTGRPWAGSALEWGSASHLTFVCIRCLLNRRNRCTMCVYQRHSNNTNSHCHRGAQVLNMINEIQQSELAMRNCHTLIRRRASLFLPRRHQFMGVALLLRKGWQIVGCQGLFFVLNLPVWYKCCLRSLFIPPLPLCASAVKVKSIFGPPDKQRLQDLFCMEQMRQVKRTKKVFINKLDLIFTPTSGYWDKCVNLFAQLPHKGPPLTNLYIMYINAWINKRWLLPPHSAASSLLSALYVLNLC